MKAEEEEAGKAASHAGKMRHRSKGRDLRHSWMTSERIVSKKLRAAAERGTYEEVLSQLRMGADASSADSKGRTALHFATVRGDASMVKLLISYGSKVNQKDCNGNTPLHLASCTHHVGVVLALLKAGTDVTATDFKGVTPLHLALSRLRIISAGDAALSTPLSRKREIEQVVDLIREYLSNVEGMKDEVKELELLASQLTLSHTPKEVDDVQTLLENFTSLSIQKRE